MNSTQYLTTIATSTSNCQPETAQAELNAYLESQTQVIAPEPPRIRTPIRRAKYHDKTRIRLKQAKEVALVKCGWGTTANVKKYLAFLGLNLDLRYTCSWVALYNEIKPQIDAAKAIVDALEPPQAPKIPTHTEMLSDALSNGAIASWVEDELGGLYWIWKTSESKRELVTSCGLATYLRKLSH